jgi:hypothetical protein
MFFVTKENYFKAKDAVMKDDIVSRQSIDFRENTSLGMGKEGYYIIINGSEESIKKAKDMLKDITKEVSGKEMEDVNKKIKEQEEASIQGFGRIFG